MRKILVLAMMLGFVGCNDPFKDQMFRAYDEHPISEWLSEQEEFSMWVEMLHKCGLYNTLNLGNGVYTCFVADNDAVNDYLEQHPQYTSIGQMSVEDIDYLMRYHIISGTRIASNNLMLKLPLPTATGDYLTAGADIQAGTRYIENGTDKTPSFLTRVDLVATNGVVHCLDKLLEPLTESVWDLISSTPSYSIFSDAVQACAMDEWLHNTVRMIGEVAVRENKTVFIVPDAVFESRGISDLNDLIAFLGGGDPTDPTSGIHRFMLYHVIDKLQGYAELTNFPTGYKSMIRYGCSTLKGYSINDTGSVIEFNPQQAGEMFHIVEGKRDIPAKNGFLHEIDNLGVVPTQMAHYYVEWEPTDKFEFTVIPFYRSVKTSGSSAQRHYLKAGEIAGIRWESIPAGKASVWYLSQYVDDGRYLNNDALYWNMGNIGWLEFDLPVLPIGKYQIKVEKSNDSANGGRGVVVWGDVTLNEDVNFVNGSKVGTWGVRELTREESQTIRFTVGSVGGVFGVDRFMFLPQ